MEGPHEQQLEQCNACRIRCRIVWLVRACGHKLCENCLMTDEDALNVKCQECRKRSAICCSNAKFGCMFKSTQKEDWKMLESHSSICPYRTAPCPLLCGMHVRKRSLLSHICESCPRRVVTCVYCWNSFSSDEIKEHSERCLRSEVTCTSCKASGIVRMEMQEHLLKDCIASKKACKFSVLGCAYRGFGQEMREHEALQNHTVEMAMFIQDTLSNLEDEKKKTEYLSRENVSLNEKIDGLTSRMCELEKAFDEEANGSHRLEQLLRKSKVFRCVVEDAVEKEVRQKIEELLVRKKTSDQEVLEKRCRYLETVVELYDNRIRVLESNARLTHEIIKPVNDNFQKIFEQTYNNLLMTLRVETSTELTALKTVCCDLQERVNRTDDKFKALGNVVSEEAASPARGHFSSLNKEVAFEDMRQLKTDLEALRNQVIDVETVLQRQTRERDSVKEQMAHFKPKLAEFGRSVESLKQSTNNFVQAGNKTWQRIEKLNNLLQNFEDFGRPQDAVLLNEFHQWVINVHKLKECSKHEVPLFSKPLCDDESGGAFRLLVKIRGKEMVFVTEILSIGNPCVMSTFEFFIVISGKTTSLAVIPSRELFNPKKWMVFPFSSTVTFCSTFHAVPVVMLGRIKSKEDEFAVAISKVSGRP